MEPVLSTTCLQRVANHGAFSSAKYQCCKRDIWSTAAGLNKKNLS